MVWFEDQILVHNNAEWPARTHGERRLHVQLPLHKLLPRLIGVLLGGLADGRDDVVLAVAN